MTRNAKTFYGHSPMTHKKAATEKHNIYDDPNFDMEKLYSLYTRQFNQDDLRDHLVLSMKTFMSNLEKFKKDQEKTEELFSKVYISQFRTGTYRSCQTALLEISKHLIIR